MSDPTPRKIFISYRRADHGDFVNQDIYSALVNHFEVDNVFIDVVGISSGEYFKDVIEKKIGVTDVVVVIIGPRWVEEFDERAAKKVDDHVLHEITRALHLNKAIVPILIAGAEMPDVKTVPKEIQAICDINAANLSKFSKGKDELIHALNATYKRQIVFMQEDERVVAFSSREAEYYYDRAKCYYSLGDYAKAISELKIAIEYESHGLCYFARADAHRALAESPVPEIALLHLTEAAKDFESATQKLLNHSRAFHGLGIALKDLGELKPALQALNTAIQLNPYLHIAHKNRALAYEKLADEDFDGRSGLELAIDDYETYLELGGAFVYDDKDAVDDKIRELKEKLGKR